jgi:hypothetical protein
MRKERPRILNVRFGVNPNSSSLGVDVTFLLFGTGAVLAAGLFLSAVLRGRKAPVPVHGEQKDAK